MEEILKILTIVPSLYLSLIIATTIHELGHYTAFRQQNLPIKQISIGHPSSKYYISFNFFGTPFTLYFLSFLHPKSGGFVELTTLENLPIFSRFQYAWLFGSGIIFNFFTAIIFYLLRTFFPSISIFNDLFLLNTLSIPFALFGEDGRQVWKAIKHKNTSS